MQTLLSLGNTTSCCHKDTIEEIRMTVMEFTADLSQGTSEKSTESLFLTGSDVTQNTDVLRENVFASTEDSDWGELRRSIAGSVRRNGIDGHFFEFSENGTDLETFLEVIVLIGVNKLDILASVEDNSVILIVTLAVAEDRIAGKLNTEFGSSHTVLHNLTMSVDQSGVDTSLFAFTRRWFFIEIGDLQIRVCTKDEFGILAFLRSEFRITLHRNNEFELSASHAFEFPVEFIRVTAKHLDNFGIFNSIQKLDRTRVIHETRDSTIKRL